MSTPAARSADPVPSAGLDIVIIAPDGAADDVRAGIERGRVLAYAARLGRDLANCPAAVLSAARMAQVAEEVGRAPRHGRRAGAGRRGITPVG